MDIILSTRNPTKAIEIKTMLKEFNVNILTLSEAGIQGEAVEDGNTLEENAAKKIDYAGLQLNNGAAWIMADDSGIFITALDGAPGIKAARWAGDEATTEEIIHYTLKQMDGIKDRSATFKTAIVLQSPDGKKLYFEGLTTGQLAESPKANPKPAMPYTAIFSPDGTNKVLAEMTIEEQKGLSSRGKAVLQVVAFLKGFLNG
jgi:XTP/dITP diphosphohydrolase